MKKFKNGMKWMSGSFWLLAASPLAMASASAALAADFQVKVQGIAIGFSDTSDDDSYASLQQACTDLKARAQATAGDRLQKVDCGSAKYIGSDEDQLDQYESMATLSVASDSVRTLRSGVVEGPLVQGIDAPSVQQALDSHKAACDQFLSNMQSRYGARMLLADCGERIKTATVDSVKFSSQGMVYLAQSGGPSTGNPSPTPSGSPTSPPVQQNPKPQPVPNPVPSNPVPPVVIPPVACTPDARIPMLQQQLSSCSQAEVGIQGGVNQAEQNRQAMIAKIGSIGSIQQSMGQCSHERDRLEEQLRAIRGSIEQSTHQRNEAAQQLNRLQTELNQVRKPILGYVCYAFDKKYGTIAVASASTQDQAQALALRQCGEMCRKHDAHKGCDAFYTPNP